MLLVEVGKECVRWERLVRSLRGKLLFSFLISCVRKRGDIRQREFLFLSISPRLPPSFSTPPVRLRCNNYKNLNPTRLNSTHILRASAAPVYTLRLQEVCLFS